MLTNREMVNFKRLDFLRFLTINCVTTEARELNVTNQFLLDTHNSKRRLRESLDEISSGLTRMKENIVGKK